MYLNWLILDTVSTYRDIIMIRDTLYFNPSKSQLSTTYRKVRANLRFFFGNCRLADILGKLSFELTRLCQFQIAHFLTHMTK